MISMLNNQKGLSKILILGIIAAVVLIGVGIGGYLVFVKKTNGPQPSFPPGPRIVGQEIIRGGKVIRKNTEPLSRDGDGVLELSIVEEKNLTVLIPARESLCRTKNVLGVFNEIKAGDVVLVFGELVDENTIRLCGSEKYYLRVENEKTSSSTIDISNWQTYRNDKYGFEVKYPRNWIDDPRTMSSLGIKQGMSDVGKNDRLSIVYEPQNSKCSEDEGCSYPAWIIMQPIKMSGELINTQASFREFVSSYRKKYLDDGAELSSKELAVDGHWAIELSVTKRKNNQASVLVPSITLFIYHSPSTIIWMGVRHFDEYRDIVVQALNQILSTFKFTPTSN